MGTHHHHRKENSMLNNCDNGHEWVNHGGRMVCYRCGASG